MAQCSGGFTQSMPTWVPSSKRFAVNCAWTTAMAASMYDFSQWSETLDPGGKHASSQHLHVAKDCDHA